MNISDIYAGKPDASDEIRERGYEEFANSYIKPSGINIERLASTIYGTPFFIMGDKGTGKTALLHFLTQYVHSIDSAACSSFIFFESGYTHLVREKLNTISKSISTSISIDDSIASSGKNIECDFTYVWKWQFYQKIINDNDYFKGGLFINDKNWNAFIKEISKISKTINTEKMIIPAKISVTATANPQFGTITPGITVEPVDFSQRSFNTAKGYKEFVKILDKADYLVKTITRTDIPYYIFIDELEAYRGESDTFYRDLRMIRDLLFTVKRSNDVFQNGTKIICSVRPEILNAINRFVQSNQLHKIMQSYDERLLWEYTNTNSFNHPIIGVLIKRIENAEIRNSRYPIGKEDITKKWFAPTVYNTHICTYILDNTWHKPRDIVRLLLAAQSKNSKNFSFFNQNTFDTFMPAYSKQCLVEVREEMRALYAAEEIECIINCLQGFKVIFSYQEVAERAKMLYPNNIMASEPYTVLNDMYRIGLIGNILTSNHSTRWEYKQQYKLFIDDPWKIIIHPSLRIELSVSGKIDKYINRNQSGGVRTSMNSEIFKATVKVIRYRYIIVSFEKEGYIQEGYISLNNLGCYKAEEGQINSLLSVGDTVTVQMTGYNTNYSNWYMRIVD